ncbi:MAG: acyltransferase [Longimicrobiales bacterium]
MAFLPLRDVALPAATRTAYDEWLRTIEARISDPATDRDELCREILTDLYYPGLAGADPDTLRPAARIALMQLDPRNVTLEPEYYAETDVEAFARVKPLLWLWEMFDKSPLGENIHIGVRFRRILARHVFRRCGENFKCFQYVKFSFGYNMEVGDNVVVHRHVLLDDRAPIVMGNGVSVADYTNIYTHTHALADQRDVECKPVHLDDGVRVAYHAVILAGMHLHADSMLGTMAVATKDVESGKVAMGIPAVPKLEKPPKDQRPGHPKTTDPLAGL